MLDFHTHSTASDGILKPAALVSRACEAGVRYLALTDHDTVAGIDEAQRAARDLDITVVPGVEVSSQWRGVGIHVVGLGVDANGVDFLSDLEAQQQRRQQRAELIAEKLSKQGIANALEGATEVAAGAPVARPHFAQHLINQGHVRNAQQAFKRYLGKGKAGDVKHLWPELDEAVAIIQRAGGVAVLAHPLHYHFTHRKLGQLLADFQGVGGRAVEVISGQQASADTQRLAELAERFELWASCGSDFHSPDNPWQSLGGFGTLPAACTPVPLSLLVPTPNSVPEDASC